MEHNCPICKKKHNIFNIICLNLYVKHYNQITFNEVKIPEIKKVKEKLKNENYKCQKCGIYLSNITNHRNHTQKNICQKKQKIECKKCGKEFLDKRNLAYHVDHAVCTRKEQKLAQNKVEEIDNNIEEEINCEELDEEEIDNNIEEINNNFIEEENIVLELNNIVENINNENLISNEEKEIFITDKINSIISSLDLNNFEQIMNTLTNIEYELKKKNDKTKKQKIPAALKAKVWNHWIGEEIGKIKCLCCDNNYITQSSFSCGHIIPESKGGELSIHNLKPICHLCNSSMYNTNMNEFVAKFNLNK